MKKFTLVELIVVVVTISILAAVTIPNISNFGKSSRETAMVANERGVEVAVDRFYIKNGYYPVNSEGNEVDGRKMVDLDELIPEFLHEKPKGSFFVDENGKVSYESEESEVVTGEVEMPKVDKIIDGVGALSWAYSLVHGQDFFTTTEITIPQNVKAYEGVTIVDTSSDPLKLESARLLVEGKESGIKTSIEGQEVFVHLSKNDLSKVRGKKITLHTKMNNLSTYFHKDNETQTTVIVDYIEGGKKEQKTITSNLIKTKYKYLETKQIVVGDGIKYHNNYEIPETTKEFTLEFSLPLPKLEEIGEEGDFQYLEFRNHFDSEFQMISAEVFFDGVKDTNRKNNTDFIFTTRLYKDEYEKYHGKEMVVKIKTKLRDGVEVEKLRNSGVVNIHYKNGYRGFGTDGVELDFGSEW